MPREDVRRTPSPDDIIAAAVWLATEDYSPAQLRDSYRAAAGVEPRTLDDDPMTQRLVLDRAPDGTPKVHPAVRAALADLVVERSLSQPS